MSSSLALAVPKAPLGATVDGVCALIRDFPERRAELCAKLRLFIEGNGYTAAQLAKHLRGAYEPADAQAWIDWFAESEVFPADASGAVLPQPGKALGATQIQDPQTVLQPEKIEPKKIEPKKIEPKKIEASAPPVPKNEADSVAESNIAKQLASCARSVLVIGREDNLTADLLRALAKESLGLWPETELKIIDLGASPWLGLQCDENLVSYITRGVDEDMLIACEAIKAVWQSYQQKTKLIKRAMRSYQELPPVCPIRLLITGWPLFCSWAKTYTANRLSDYALLAKSKSVSNPLPPMQAVANVGHIIAGGSVSGVVCYLAGKEGSPASTGFTADVLQSAEIAAIGQGGDYTIMLGLAQRCSSSFAQQAQQAINAGKRVVATTQNGGQLLEAPDYAAALQSSLRHCTAVRFYRKPVVKSMRAGA